MFIHILNFEFLNLVLKTVTIMICFGLGRKLSGQNTCCVFMKLNYEPQLLHKQTSKAVHRQNRIAEHVEENASSIFWSVSSSQTEFPGLIKDVVSKRELERNRGRH